MRFWFLYKMVIEIWLSPKDRTPGNVVEAIDGEKESTDGKEMRVKSLYLLVTAKKTRFYFYSWLIK